MLRLTIILLGLQLAARQVVEVGLAGMAIIVVALAAIFLFTVSLGRMHAWRRAQARRTDAAGTPICGAPAMIATNTVTGALEEDVAYAVACVTVFGPIAILVYSMLPSVLGVDAHRFGLWAASLFIAGFSLTLVKFLA